MLVIVCQHAYANVSVFKTETRKIYLMRELTSRDRGKLDVSCWNL